MVSTACLVGGSVKKLLDEGVYLPAKLTFSTRVTVANNSCI